MRYHLAEAIRINGLPEERRRAEIRQLPLGTRTTVAVLAKYLQRPHANDRRANNNPRRNGAP